MTRKRKASAARGVRSRVGREESGVVNRGSGQRPESARPIPGQPRTRQRDAIARVLADAARPLSPAEILSAARRRVRSLGQATVYRSIGQLVGTGDAVAVVLPGQPPRYELAGAAARHHHHFHCDSCDRVFDVHGCAPGLDALAPRGFSVARHEVVLYGTCPECA